MGIQSCLACQLALQHEAPHLACDQGLVLGEGPPGLTIVVSERLRSHEGPAWVLAAIGAECSASMAECRRGIIDGKFNEWNVQLPIFLVTINKAAKHVFNYSIDTLSE